MAWGGCIDTEGLKLIKIGICQFDIFKNKSINRFYSTIRSINYYDVGECQFDILKNKSINRFYSTILETRSHRALRRS